MAKIEEGTTVLFEKNGKPWQKVWQKCWGGCRGTGYISYYAHYAQGVCFKCEGVGGRWKESRVLNEKEQAKRDAAKARKEARKESEMAQRIEADNQKDIEKMGFENGSIHVVIGVNTFDIKEELKEKGAQFNGFGWYFKIPTDGYQTVEIKFEEVFFKNENGKLIITPTPMEMKRMVKDRTPKTTESQYIGTIGEKIEIDITVKRIFGFESKFGYKKVIIMEDADGNVFKYVTQSCYLQEGETVKLVGTVKDHTEYDDVKQTVITRCKAKA
jgi:hypothetical protein